MIRRTAGTALLDSGGKGLPGLKKAKTSASQVLPAAKRPLVERQKDIAHISGTLDLTSNPRITAEQVIEHNARTYTNVPCEDRATATRGPRPSISMQDVHKIAHALQQDRRHIVLPYWFTERGYVYGDLMKEFFSAKDEHGAYLTSKSQSADLVPFGLWELFVGVIDGENEVARAEANGPGEYPEKANEQTAGDQSAPPFSPLSLSTNVRMSDTAPSVKPFAASRRSDASVKNSQPMATATTASNIDLESHRKLASSLNAVMNAKIALDAVKGLVKQFEELSSIDYGGVSLRTPLRDLLGDLKTAQASFEEVVRRSSHREENYQL